VNADWEEVTVVYGLLDASDENTLQEIKISKAFLGEMDAYEMALSADSINFSEEDLDVKIVRFVNNGNTDTLSLLAVPTVRNPGDFNDTIMIYTFENDNFLKSNSEYELIIENKKSGNIVTSKTGIISGFKFDMPSSFQFGLLSNFTEGTPSATEFSYSTVTWGNSNDNGSIYQLDLVINYTEKTGDNYIEKELLYSQGLVDEQVSKITIEGEKFFNFMKKELTKDDTKVRFFNGIDLVMTVGSEDLETYIKVNKPISGIVQERPQFTNISNGIGLFSSIFIKVRYNLPLTTESKKYLKSIDGLDRNFQ